MTLKDILVHIDNSESNAIRLDFAIALASQHKAHLTGLYISPEIYIPSYPGMLHDATIFEALQAAEQARMDNAEKAFHHAISETVGFTSEWRGERSGWERNFVSHTATSDLVIVSQPDENDPNVTDSGFVEYVILASGRPVLILPPEGRLRPNIERVVVAWNASREAVRALHDALPLLQTAEQIDLLMINLPQNDLPAEVCTHLSRHGIRVEPKFISSDTKAAGGDVILAHAAKQGADLIVMGAYGHSRWRELVLGGTSRHVLKNSSLPVFMSH